MTNKDILNRVKQIEIEQGPLNDEIKILYEIINRHGEDTEDLVSQEIYYEKNSIMKSLIAEKTNLLIGLGFTPVDGLIDESLRETALWKQIDADYVDLETADLRYSACTNCPEFVTISKQCKSLGVFAKEYSAIESSTCPIGNW